MKISSSRTHKKTAAVAIAVIFLAICATGSLLWYSRMSTKEEGAIDYSPATKDDRTYNNSLKEELSDNQKETQSVNDDVGSEDTTRQVSPVISAYGQPNGPGTNFTLNGFVPGIIESDGACTLTLTRGDKKVVVNKKALQNAQNTSCGQLIISFDKLGDTGEWLAVLSYNSPSSSGFSTSTKVNIK